MRLLITGLNWPPETFLRPLIDGLVEAGVEVTVGSARRPEKAAGIKWLETPSWDARPPLKLGRLLGMATRAFIFGLRDLNTLGRGLGRRKCFGERLQAWNRLLPYAGRR